VGKPTGFLDHARRDPGHRPAAELQLPQRHQRHVPHQQVIRVVLEQHHRTGGDHAPPGDVVHAQITGLGHALQDRRTRCRHALILS